MPELVREAAPCKNSLLLRSSDARTVEDDLDVVIEDRVCAIRCGCRVTGRGLPYGDMVWGVRTRSVVVGGPVSLSVVGRECRLLDGGGNKWPYATEQRALTTVMLKL